jgi:ribosomal protein S18 acetylase RimI-like enzyme
MDKFNYRKGQKVPFTPIVIPFYENIKGYKQVQQSHIQQVFGEESKRCESMFLTDHDTTHLAGIFPHAGEEAFFGFWETKDRKVNREAFELLEESAKERGYVKLTGPLNFNTFHSYRLKLGTPSWKYFTHEPVNPLYYPDWLQKLGYEEHMKYESRKLEEEAVQMVYQMKSTFLETLKDLPYNILEITKELWQQRIKEIYHLVDVIFGENPYYQQISFEHFRDQYNLDFVAMLCPYCSSFFEDPESGKLVAMSFSYPDYSQLGVQEKYSFEADFDRLEDPCLLIKSIGVHPAHRNKGLMNYLAAHGMQNFLDHYKTAMFCLMRSDNVSLSYTEPLPYERAEYALFSKIL